MREAYDADFIYTDKGGSLIGVSLGADYCAEHEQGTKDMKRMLGVWTGDPKKDKKVLGWDRHRCTFPLKIQQFSVETKFIKPGNKRESKGTVYAIVLDTGWGVEYDENEFVNERFSRYREYVKNKTYGEFTEKRPLRSMWDSSSFLIWSPDQEKMLTLFEAFKDGKMLYGLPVSKNPFARSGPMFLIEDYIDKEEERAVIEEQKKYYEMWKRIYKTKVFKKLDKAGRRFYACTPEQVQFESHVSDTDHRKISDVQKRSKLKDIMFFLNPMQQDIYEHGWFSVEELEMWCQNKGPIIKEGADLRNSNTFGKIFR